MQIQRVGQDLVIVLPPEVVQWQGLREGDEVVVMKTTDPATFEQALREVLREVLRDHADTVEFLKDK